ncbi:MAG TPA: ABC transporter permease, partial [Candidatus Binatia bacterium]|nr:ABC transporter permease [Candidatus Binatia bacterium]
MVAKDAADAAAGFAGQWRLTWLKFREHKLALVSAVFIGAVYLVALFAEFLAPSVPEAYNPSFTLVQPQSIHLFRTDAGGWHFEPHVTGFTATRDPRTLRRTFAADENVRIPIGLLVQGQPYHLFGLIPATTHLIGPIDQTQPFYLFGSDRLGRDVLTRLIYG